MNRSHLPLALLLGAVLFSARAQTEVETIVPPSNQISEFNARQELVRVLWKLGKTEAAESELRGLLEIRRNDPVLLADLADIEAARGHFARSRDLYEHALTKSGNAAELRLRYARQARSWGDFYLTEKVLRAYLRKHPEDIDAKLDLAGVLIAEQQYEAAEAEYRPLTKKPGARQRALIGLATGRLLQKDFQAVLPYADAVLRSDPKQIEALNLRAEALWRLHRYNEAKEDFRRLSTLSGGRLFGWIGLGRLARAQKDEKSAEEYFRRAQESDSRNIRTRYLLAGGPAAESGFVHRMVASPSVTLEDLNTLAGLYAEDGHLDSAITLYQAALAKDREYFPARIGLAQAFATAHRYGESIELLTRLHNEFPDNAKIILSLARVLSWSRRYDESIRTYRELSALNPADTVPRKEMAQVATWR
jgi:tetratricopeptide (TPR) repeat protein